jgi:hypothetical protein
MHPVLNAALASRAVPNLTVINVLVATAKSQESVLGARLDALNELSAILVGDKHDNELSAAAVTAGWSCEIEDASQKFIKENLKVLFLPFHLRWELDILLASKSTHALDCKCSCLIVLYTCIHLEFVSIQGLLLPSLGPILLDRNPAIAYSAAKILARIGAALGSDAADFIEWALKYVDHEQLHGQHDQVRLRIHSFCFSKKKTNFRDTDAGSQTCCRYG